MNGYSLALAMGLSVLVALGLGWWLRLRGFSSALASAWATAAAVSLSIPALLSSAPADMTRLVWPREAIDWLPMGTLLLVAMATVVQRPLPLRLNEAEVDDAAPAVRASIGWVAAIGVLLGICLAMRLMFGSIYLRAGQVELASLVKIVGWGMCIGGLWMAMFPQRLRRSWTELIVCSIVMVAVAMTLTMSGSFQYGMVGVLVTIASVSAWIATGYWPRISLIVATILLGLATAFAEPSQGAITAMGVTIFSVGLALVLEEDRSRKTLRATLMAVGVIVALGSTTLTAQQFLAKLQPTNSTNDGGYGAYK